MKKPFDDFDDFRLPDKFDLKSNKPDPLDKFDLKSNKPDPLDKPDLNTDRFDLQNDRCDFLERYIKSPRSRELDPLVSKKDPPLFNIDRPSLPEKPPQELISVTHSVPRKDIFDPKSFYKSWLFPDQPLPCPITKPPDYSDQTSSKEPSRLELYLEMIDPSLINVSAALRNVRSPYPTELDRFLDRIDPSNTLDAWAAKVDDAINSFRCDRAIIEDGTELRLLGRFYNHIINSLQPPVHLSELDAWCDCYGNVIKHVYGEKNGVLIVSRMVRKGTQGGLRRALEDIAKHMLNDFALMKLKGMVWKFWIKLSGGDKARMTHEYYDKHRELLPSEIKEAGRDALSMWFPEVLEAHPRILQHVRSQVRKENR